MNKTKLIFTGILAFTVTMGVNAASFDCKKAKSKVEKSICGDSELSQLDEQLAEAYKKNIATHPLPSYVKARQRDWLKLNPYCDPKNFKICLKKNYKERLIYLQNLNPVVYSNSKQFSYDNGDAVAEFMQVGPSQWRLSIWGGFSFHNQAQAFVGCEFEGNVSAIADGLATSIDGSSVKYQIQGNEFVLDPAAEICAGFGRMPENMLKINP